MICESKEKCCGCGACASICPKECITMVQDYEGFLYPECDMSKCIHCSRCERVCPELNYTLNNDSLKSLAIQCKNDIKRAQSTAGGGFFPIAEYVLKNGGVVYGATFNENFHVHHIGVDKVDNLPKILGSKYVQSEIGDSYSDVKDKLLQGSWVAFSGTPCQIAGLNNYLKDNGKLHNSEKLITVSVACRAVPSPLIFAKYIELRNEDFHDSIAKICCRDKYYGYSYSTMSVYGNEKSKHRDYHCAIESDEWLRCFFSGVCDRPCCSTCDFKGPIGDFHIGDYFRVGDVAPELDDNRGTTRMIIGSERGLKYFDHIKSEYRIHELSNETMQSTTQNALTAFGHDVDKRKNFFEDANKMSGKELFGKYYSRTMKVQILQIGRFVTYRIGIYKYLKK